MDKEDVHDENSNISWPLRVVLIFLFMWQFAFGISNAGLRALFHFLQKLFTLLQSYQKDNGLIQEFNVKFPGSREAALKLIGINSNRFIKYIVCPSCDSVFDYAYGYSKDGNNNEVPVQCPHIEMPHHPQASQRRPCGAFLMQSVICNNSTSTFVKAKPFKIFAYQSLKVALTNLVNTKGFIEQCDLWKSRYANLPEDALGDIYDGMVWKEFMLNEGTNNSLVSKYNFCLTLNVDWFQPFSHTRKLKQHRIT